MTYVSDTAMMFNKTSWYEEPTLADGVFAALEALLIHGDFVEGENQNMTEILLEDKLVMQISNPLDGEYPIPKCIAGGLEDLKAYVDEFLIGTKDGDFTYTYHELYMKYWAQSENEIARYKYTRRATLPIAGDASYASQYPPCLQLLLPRIVKDVYTQSERLDLTAVFRSNDAVNAFPMNAFAISMMQKQLAEKYGVQCGELLYIANSFHCYYKDLSKLAAYVRRWKNSDESYDYGFSMAEYEEDS